MTIPMRKTSSPLPAISIDSLVSFKMFYDLFLAIKRKIYDLWESTARITMNLPSLVVHMTKSTGNELFRAAIYFAKPFARLIQRIHTQTLSLNGEIRKGLLSLPQFS